MVEIKDEFYREVQEGMLVDAFGEWDVVWRYRMEHQRAMERLGRCLLWIWLNIGSAPMRETSFG
jgi:hypothetical protein